MKICAISDLHGNLVDINPADVLFICGDIIPLCHQRNVPDSMAWLEKVFIPWCEKQPVSQIYLIAGNHDFAFENRDVEINKLFLGTKVIYLNNQSAEYLDTETGKVYTIWGSPLCHIFGNWAFMENPEYELTQFEKIPDNLDFLITHDAAYGRSDVVLDNSVWWADGSHIGNPELAEVLKTKHPKYHFFGHLHSCNHDFVDFEGTQTACVSLLNERYKLAYEPLYLEL